MIYHLRHSCSQGDAASMFAALADEGGEDGEVENGEVEEVAAAPAKKKGDKKKGKDVASLFAALEVAGE